MPELEELIAEIKPMSAELDKRIARHNKLEPYLVGEAPLPPAVQEAKLTKLYRWLMPVAEAPWGSLIVDSKLDRLELRSITDPVDQAVAERIWNEVWQPNEMDSESKLAHGAALLDGRCYATVWAGEDGTPDIALDDVTQMIVKFAEGSRHKRAAALRRWVSGDTKYATLFRPESIYRFKGPDGEAKSTTEEWTPLGPDWELENPFGAVNVVEVAVNRRLKPGVFPVARGEFEHCIGLIDRINLLTFLGLVVAFWMGFPLRGVIGEKARRRVLKDDEGNALIDEDTGKEKTEVVPVIDAKPNSFFQLTNPDARLAEFDAADRGTLSIYPELDQLAVITKTPRHYFPMENGLSNMSPEAIMASEGGMHAAVTGHMSSLGGSWEDVGRLAGKVLDPPVDLSRQAKMEWYDHHSRSLAERADAASKLKDVLPAAAVAELVMNLSPSQIAAFASQSAVDPLMKILEAAQNGNGTSAVPAG